MMAVGIHPQMNANGHSLWEHGVPPGLGLQGRSHSIRTEFSRRRKKRPQRGAAALPGRTQGTGEALLTVEGDPDKPAAVAILSPDRIAHARTARVKGRCAGLASAFQRRRSVRTAKARSRFVPSLLPN